MRRRLLATIAGVGAVALTAGALPAFTADSGTINVTVTAEAPSAPCVAFATPPGTQVNFGTQPFSQSGNPSDHQGDVAPRFSNCGTAAETFLIGGTDATSQPSAGGAPPATWTLGGGTGNSCPALDTYRLFYNTDNIGSWPITKANATLRNLADGTTTFAVGEAHNLGLEIVMPCQGSGGAGLSFSLSTTLTALVA